MSKRYLVGVDLGTSATKATLYTTDGAVVADATADVPLHHPYPGAVEQEMSDFYGTAAATVRECMGDSGVDPRDVAAIAFASQMAGVGAVDEGFRPATRFDSWLDMRCQPYIEEIDRNHGDLVTRLTGCPPTCDHGPKILWWQHERPADYRAHGPLCHACRLCCGRDGRPLRGRRVHRLHLPALHRLERRARRGSGLPRYAARSA